MNITFIVPMLNLTGGLRVIAIYANLLAKKGHTVTVISPAGKEPSFVQKVKSSLRWKGYSFDSGFDDSFFCNSACNIKVLDKYRPINNEDVPDADIVIATFWYTAEWVATYDFKKGKKVYFIQHYEVFDYLPIDRVEKTYRLPFYKVVIANWLVSIMEEKYKSDRLFLVPNSVEHELFHADVRGKQGTPTIGFLFSESPFKGVNVALKVIQNLKATIPNLRVIAFGARLPVNISVPDYVELSINPPQDEIRLLYQQCDLWLCCSLSEGFGLTILEAMACRVPAIATKCGGPEDIITDNINGYLCNVNDVECLTSAAHKVLRFSNEEWQTFSDKAYQHAVNYTWDDAAKLFEEALQKIR
jgi:glycosyltransferase involved in cell wall biosynthesis